MNNNIKFGYLRKIVALTPRQAHPEISFAHVVTAVVTINTRTNKPIKIIKDGGFTEAQQRVVSYLNTKLGNLKSRTLSLFFLKGEPKKVYVSVSGTNKGKIQNFRKRIAENPLEGVELVIIGDQESDIVSSATPQKVGLSDPESSVYKAFSIPVEARFLNRVIQQNPKYQLKDIDVTDLRTLWDSEQFNSLFNAYVLEIERFQTCCEMEGNGSSTDDFPEQFSNQGGYQDWLESMQIFRPEDDIEELKRSLIPAFPLLLPDDGLTIGDLKSDHGKVTFFYYLLTRFDCLWDDLRQKLIESNELNVDEIVDRTLTIMNTVSGFDRKQLADHLDQCAEGHMVEFMAKHPEIFSQGGVLFAVRPADKLTEVKPPCCVCENNFVHHVWESQNDTL